MPPKHSYRANGKVLVSGEYLVLDGALALGLPLSVGQSLTVKESSGSDITWESYCPNGQRWFSGKFDLFGLECMKSSDQKIADGLSGIFEAAVRLNSDFLSRWKKYTVRTHLDFEPCWGLGSSSTLISCVAKWADVDPYELSSMTFGGSGYDIACAEADTPIFYSNDADSISIERADFNPSFRDQLYFIYLGQKQNSAKEVANYRERNVNATAIEEISAISKSFCEVDSLPHFEELIVDHEKLVSEIIGIPRIREEFNGFWGEIKSLGAWGGDFILVTSDRSLSETQSYFQNHGLDVFFRFDELVRHSEQTVSTC